MRARVKLSETVGTSTRFSQYRKLLADSANIPESIRGDMTEIKNELELAVFQPLPPIQYAWHVYWQIRRTLTRDYPIKHQDILAQQQLSEIKLTNWEVDLIFDWDTTFYEVLK